MKTKKLFLMATMLLMCICSFAQNGNTPLKGDVNGDGKVDVADIVAILKIMKDPVINLTPSSDQTITEPITISSTVTNGVSANTNWAITYEGTSGETFRKSASIGESIIITPNDTSAPEANKGIVSMTTGSQSQSTSNGAIVLDASFTPGQNTTKEYSTRLTASYDRAEPVSINITFSKTTNALSAGTYEWTVVGTLPSGVQLISNGASASLTNTNSESKTIPANTIKVENTNGIAAAFNTAITVPGKSETNTYYWYVGPTDPSTMTSISPIVTDNSSPGWREIGTTLPTSGTVLFDGTDSINVASSKVTQYFAINSTNVNLGFYDSLGNEDTLFATGPTVSSNGWNIYTSNSRSKTFDNVLKIK